MSDTSANFKMLSRITVRESACTALRKMVVQGRLPAGQPLHQGSLAGQLGISRTPLREALHTLNAEGLVTFDSNGTAYVVAPSVEALREIYSIRQVLEVLAGRAAVENITDEAIAQAETIADAMEDVSDPVEWAGLNAAFHKVIYDAAGKPQLFELIEILRNRARLYVTLLAADLKNTTSAADEHRAMLEALRARNADALEALILLHLTTTTFKVGASLTDDSKATASVRVEPDMEGTG